MHQNKGIYKLERLFFVINPCAGYERVHKEWFKIAKLISNENFDYNFEFTGYVGHAEEIVKGKIQEGYRKFIIVGGDGTVNEVINGIFKQKDIPTTEFYLGLFAMGSGNDWARYYKFTQDYNESIDRIKWGQTVTQDVGKITYYDGNKPKEVYFVNTAGLCFDAIVGRKRPKGKVSVLYSLIRSLIKYNPEFLKVYIDDDIIREDLLSISIGNGRYSASGMLQTPEAIIDDGLLDVTIYPNMSKLNVINSVIKLYKGETFNIKGLRQFRTDKIRIESIGDTFIEIEGELIEGNNFNFSVVPNSINILV